MEDENARLKAELSSLQGDNEVLRLQLAAKRSTFVDAEVDALQEELGRVRAEEREACAQLVDSDVEGFGDHVVADRIAAAIRAREALSSTPRKLDVAKCDIKPDTPQPSGLTGRPMIPFSEDTWLREQIAFAIWNSTNPAAVRDKLTIETIEGNELRSDLGDGWSGTLDLGLDWRLNRDSFLKLATVAIRAFEKADEDGTAYQDSDASATADSRPLAASTPSNSTSQAIAQERDEGGDR
jgi:hypothetical protein